MSECYTSSFHSGWWLFDFCPKKMFNSIAALPKKSQVAQVDLSGEPGVSSFAQVTDGKKIDLELLLTEILFKQTLFKRLFSLLTA